MKKIGFMFIGILFVTYCHAQTMARIIVSSCGTSSKNGSIQLNYTVGEAVVAYVKSNGSPTYTLSQGYHQWDSVAGTNSSVKNETSNKNYVHLSPNPATQYVNVNSFIELPVAVNYTIFNSLGQVCLSINSESILTGQNDQKIDISKLSAGSYFIQVSSINTDIYFVKKLPLIILN